MTPSRSFHPSLLAVMVAALMTWAAPAKAFDDDEMTFDVEDVEDASDDEMTFAPGDLEEPAAAPATKPSVAVVAVPGPDLEGERRATLQAELKGAMEAVPGYEIYGDSDILPLLEDRDPMSCVREPLCLASIGRNSGVERILIAVVTQTPGGYKLDINFFNVSDRLFERYHTKPNVRGFNNVVGAARPGIAEMFNIRVPRSENFHDDDAGNIQRILAYTTAGLAVASLGTGIYFGLDASAQEDDLAGMPKNEKGAYTTLTQRQAQQRVRDIESSATTANIFYGLSVGLGLTSALLFYIEGDVADEEASASTDSLWRRTRFAPAISTDTIGIGAHLRF